MIDRYLGIFLISALAEPRAPFEWVANGSISFIGRREARIFGAPPASATTAEDAEVLFRIHAHAAIDALMALTRRSTPLGALARFFLDAAVRHDLVEEVEVGPASFALLLDEAGARAGSTGDRGAIDLGLETITLVRATSSAPGEGEARLFDGLETRRTTSFDLGATAPPGGWSPRDPEQ